MPAVQPYTSSVAKTRRRPAPDLPPQTSEDSVGQSLVRALALTTFLLWLGASAILPLLPEYLHDRGATDALVGVVMASYFVAALACQYPAGRLADKIGRRPVLIGGLVCYAAGSFGYLAPVGPVADIGFRSLQGAGAGAAEVAALAMVAGNVALGRRGRAFASIYGAQLAAMAVGPLAGSLIGLSEMNVVFVLAGAIAVAACLPVIFGGVVARADTEYTANDRHSDRGLPSLNRALVGALCTAGALGLTIGVYESCWTLLLESHHASDWQVGLSWTLFAVPFVAMARPGGWLADHADRRWLVIGSLASSVFFCSLYPFVTNLSLLLALGGLEAVGLAVALPSAQSLLTQGSTQHELGRVQGLFSTSETAAIAVSAGVAGALFSLADWAPFVAGAALAGALTACLPFIWRHVAGRATHVVAMDNAAVADGAIFSEA